MSCKKLNSKEINAFNSNKQLSQPNYVNKDTNNLKNKN